MDSIDEELDARDAFWADRRYCYGKLDNDPIATDRIECGDPVRFTPRQVAAVE